ncbi:MAG: NAD(P)H-dependent oxidoreductase [bacterium]
MNVLHVCANPRPIEESVSKQLAAAFFARLVEKNPDVIVNNIDLYQFPPPYLSYDAYNYFCKPLVQADHKPTKGEEKAADYAKGQIEGLLQTDVLVLTMPMWAGGPPAIMKAWLDQVMLPGILFEFSEEGVKPLHQLRSVVLLVSSGLVYKEDDPRDGITALMRNNFEFIGVTEFDVAWADGQEPNMFQDGQERKETALEAAEEIADDIATLP